jgi:putative ABC transport system ATP-binding protein
VNEPNVLLADEPTGALDQTTAAEILSLFDEIHRSGLCLIIVTHDLEVANSCQRIIQIADGQVVSS